MTSQTLERLILAAARGILGRVDAHPCDIAVRTQAAVVRSLVDELDRHIGGESCSTFLCEQVKEELLRLLALVRRAPPAEALVASLPFHEPIPWYDVA
jgi:hypothetical protein